MRCRWRRLQDLDRISCHPDVDLLESFLQPLLELEKEPATFGLIGNIDEDPDQVIAVRLALVPPEAAYRLRHGRHGPELLLELEQCLGDEVVGHRLAVIEPQREQDLVASE